MALIQWSDRYSVGVSTLDNQHRQLIGILNDLHEAMSTARGKDVQNGIVQKLGTYAATHLETEEKLLKAQAYPTFVQHKAQHDAYIAKMKEFQDQLRKGEGGVPVALMTFLKDWWTKHILTTDKEYSAYLKAREVN
jgi:hemerythrin